MGAEQALLGRTRLRLAGWSTLITLVVVIALGVLTFVTVQQALRTANEDTLDQRARAIASLVESLPSLPADAATAPPVPIPVGVAFGGAESGTYAVVVTPDGQVVGLKRPEVSGLPDMASVEAARTASRDSRVVDTGTGLTRVLSRTVVAGGGATYVIQVADDLTGELATLAALLRMLVIAAVLAVFLAAGGGFIFASRALLPIRDSLRHQREFASNASHELRTPLAVMRGSIEHLERHPEARVADVGDALADMRAEADHLIALVDSLLLLARADSGSLEIEHVGVDVGDAAAAALGALEHVAAPAEVRLELDAEPAEVDGDPVRLRQLVSILVDNAIHHSSPGGAVRVSVRAERDRVNVVVSDGGAGIAAEDLPHVFDRFYRSPSAPPGGTGLGLSIAARIVEAHGGSIRAESAIAEGSRLVASLPRRDAR